MPAGIKPDNILRQLEKLWTEMAVPDQTEKTSSGTLRACAMTLIVAAEDSADAQTAGEVLGELMHEHPSRAIVLKPSATGELDARVFAQCWMPFGRRQQICCEQIEIAAAPDRLGDVPGLMLALLAPDLPVVLWCRGERWFAESHFGQLLPLIDKLIVDSERFSDLKSAYALIGEFIAGGTAVADLAWSRITGWREVIAQLFDTPAELHNCRGITSIEVTAGGEKPGAGAYYLAAWLNRGLPRASSTVRSDPAAPPGIQSVAVGSNTFQLRDAGSIDVHTETGPYTTVLPDASDYAAMREELAIAGRDRIFEEVRAMAQKLHAGS